MRCPSCGSVYEVSEMQFVGSKDGYFLLSMNCSKCSLPVWVNVFSGNNSGKAYARDLTINDIRFTDMEPISANEVVDFSKFISTFDGNFSSIFKKKSYKLNLQSPIYNFQFAVNNNRCIGPFDLLIIDNPDETLYP